MLKIIHILILINDENPKFKVGDHVRIFMYQNIFATNWSEAINCTSNGKVMIIRLIVGLIKKI